MCGHQKMVQCNIFRTRKTHSDSFVMLVCENFSVQSEFCVERTTKTFYLIDNHYKTIYEPTIRYSFGRMNEDF